MSRNLNDELVRLPGIAEMIGVTRGTIYQMHFHGLLPDPAFDDGVAKLWWRDDIAAWDSQRKNHLDTV